jgi:predicted transcriptional regulator
MKRKKGTATMKIGKMPRTTVSLPADVQERLEEIAKVKKVSVGWVIRDAVDKYLARGAPEPDK